MYNYLCCPSLLLALFEISFEKEVYSVMEGQTANVCIVLITAPNLEDAELINVYFNICHVLQQLPSAGEPIEQCFRQLVDASM